MTCSEWSKELVECARRHGIHAEPDRALRSHLALCAHCSQRWEAELQLTAQLRAMRVQAAALRSLDSYAGAKRRESLMRDFARLHRRPVVLPGSVQSWVWALGAAAALLVAVFVGHEAGKRTSPEAVSPATRTHEVRPEQTVIYEASGDASALSSDDFIAVPYTPPLAPGEMVRVVHADFYPEALANMGVEVDPSWSGDLPADVVVGEDGLPRAVRIAENSQF
jgi:hypothetical protein